VIGGGLGFLQEYKDRTMHSDKDMKFYLPMTLLGTMPVVLNTETREQSRKLRIRNWMMVGVTVVLVIAVSGYLYKYRAAFEIATN
jgi:hypothetical protein